MIDSGLIDKNKRSFFINDVITIDGSQFVLKFGKFKIQNSGFVIGLYLQDTSFSNLKYNVCDFINDNNLSVVNGVIKIFNEGV